MTRLAPAIFKFLTLFESKALAIIFKLGFKLFAVIIAKPFTASEETTETKPDLSQSKDNQDDDDDKEDNVHWWLRY